MNKTIRHAILLAESMGACRSFREDLIDSDAQTIDDILDRVRMNFNGSGTMQAQHLNLVTNEEFEAYHRAEQWPDDLVERIKKKYAKRLRDYPARCLLFNEIVSSTALLRHEASTSNGVRRAILSMDALTEEELVGRLKFYQVPRYVIDVVVDAFQRRLK